jgi:trk system potassium uptake protein TrkH
MNLAMVQRILGLMLVMFSLTLLVPVAVSLGFGDGHWQPFILAMAIVAGVGLVLWLPVRRVRRDLRLRDGFLIAAVFWTCLGFAGAVPLYLSDRPVLSFTEAVFEAVSGLTTSGATVIVGLDELPKSILFYRQQLQWLGGMGIIVLAVALLPVLGIGGMSLYRAETPGPMKDQKLTPRITQTAKAMWAIYALLTAACAASFWLAGMSGFDAIGHAFSALSTGGFSTHDASLGYFDSVAIEVIATVFMFLGGVNFALHFAALRRREPGVYWHDTEFKAYFWIVVSVIAFATAYLWLYGQYPTFGESLRHASLQVVSMQTSTGLLTTGFVEWPGALPPLLMALTLVCGCAGSTAGGMKVIRWLIVFRQGVCELKQLVHPSAEIPVKLAGRPVPQRVVNAVAGFFAMYFIIFAALMFMLMIFGLDQVSAWSAIATSINNTGPGLGDVAWHFRDVSDSAKWVCLIAMLVGRLEIFTFVLFLTPAFWER